MYNCDLGALGALVLVLGLLALGCHLLREEFVLHLGDVVLFEADVDQRGLLDGLPKRWPGGLDSSHLMGLASEVPGMRELVGRHGVRLLKPL